MQTTIVATQTDERPEQQVPTPIRIVRTHHNGAFGVWAWDMLSEQEKAWYVEAQARSQYVSLFDIYA